MITSEGGGENCMSQCDEESPHHDAGATRHSGKFLAISILFFFVTQKKIAELAQFQNISACLEHG